MSDSAESDIRTPVLARCMSDSDESDMHGAFPDAWMSFSGESVIQGSGAALWMSVSPESDTRSRARKKGSRREAVPYEVVRPSVTLITRYSVIANGNEMRLAARTTRLLTAALPASSPRSKLVELPLSLSAPVRLCPHLPAPARQAGCRRCARMGGGYDDDVEGDGYGDCTE